jgi:hypothetical protein
MCRHNIFCTAARVQIVFFFTLKSYNESIRAYIHTWFATVIYIDTYTHVYIHTHALASVPTTTQLWRTRTSHGGNQQAHTSDIWRDTGANSRFMAGIRLPLRRAVKEILEILIHSKLKGKPWPAASGTLASSLANLNTALTDATEETILSVRMGGI